MATIKSFTDLEQSKKLVKILPLESADMWYINGEGKPFGGYWNEESHDYDDIPCWSLAALLSVLPIVNLCAVTLKMKLNHKYYMDLCTNIVNYKYISTDDYDNPVDACVEMIIKLKELNLL